MPGGTTGAHCRADRRHCGKRTREDPHLRHEAVLIQVEPDDTLHGSALEVGPKAQHKAVSAPTSSVNTNADVVSKTMRKSSVMA